MHVDDFLATPLPDVTIDTEGALTHTVQRGERRRRRNRTAGVGIAVVVVGVAATAVGLGAMRDRPDKVSTGPTAPSTTTTTPSRQPEPGDPATWVVDPVPSGLPSADASTVSVLVTREGCYSGETGRVLRPGVVVEDTRIVVTFTVESAGEGVFTCQGNPAVAYRVDVGEPLGDRALVDGRCIDGAGHCEDDGVRWQPLKAPLRKVSGVLQMVGGPAGADPDPMAGAILAYDEARRPVAQTTADAAGRFTIELPAGTYDLVGTGANFVTTESTCHTYHGVTVRDEDVAGVTVDCLRR